MENKKLCAKCKKYYHPVKYSMCFSCYSSQTARITQYKKPKDYTNLLDNQFEAKHSW